MNYNPVVGRARYDDREIGSFVFTESAPPTSESSSGSLPRSLAESLVSLLIAVILFRTFLAEGYMISTGSMAPTLLGYHKRVVCPTCQAEFAFGVAYDTDDPDEVEADTLRRQKAICPDCGQAGIMVGDVPRNHGDQLLVFKQAYAHRSPRRWEVIVFRNPADPLEAFVKRVAALPGETIEIVDGDLVINGELSRKDWSDQREIRIPVHRHHAVSSVDPEITVRAHWIAEPAATEEGPAWQPDGDGFLLMTDDADEFAWVNYAHWVRRGGQYQTAVPLAAWPSAIQPQSVPPAGLRYDKQTRRLSVLGALPERVRDRLVELCSDHEFRTAVEELYEQSHIAPITDFYGYNAGDQQQTPTTVRDIMWSGRVEVQRGRGEFRIELSTGPKDFTVAFDFERGDVRLHINSQDEPDLTGSLPTSLALGKGLIEVSLFDQQLLVIVDGKPVLEPYRFTTPPDSRVTRHPLRFGAKGMTIFVDEIVVYRDVYYTPHSGGHGNSEPYELDADEFFVLGDNSPVSHDSRRWLHAPVPRALLVGKPFLVHMPSKPGHLNLGGRELQLRLPDVERIRLLK